MNANILISASSGSNLWLLKFSELDVCIYLMSAVGIKMEVEEGASATASELVNVTNIKVPPKLSRILII